MALRRPGFENTTVANAPWVVRFTEGFIDPRVAHWPPRTKSDTFIYVDWPFLQTHGPYGMAHRGGRGDAPENTMAAFKRAVDLGYRYLETDVHRTADGHLIAFHDVDLRRVAGLNGVVEDYRWKQLSEVRLEGGHRIPLLSALLEEFPTTHFNIDPKSDGAVEPLAKLIGSMEVIDRVCIGSFSDQRITQAQQLLGPKLCTSAGPRSIAKILAIATFLPFGYLLRKATKPFGCLQIPVKAYGLRFDRARTIRRIQKAGLQVHFWTINDAAEMHRLLDAGADAIISDEIVTLRDVLAVRSSPGAASSTAASPTPLRDT